MLAFLREANTARSIVEIIDDLYLRLGPNYFRNLFPVILADRGSEFTNPLAIEFDPDGNQRTNMFYCDANAPYQKGGIEVAHEMIRRIIPKGTSLNRFEQEGHQLDDGSHQFLRKKKTEQPVCTPVVQLLSWRGCFKETQCQLH
jgi:hypothetical protein